MSETSRAPSPFTSPFAAYSYAPMSHAAPSGRYAPRRSVGVLNAQDVRFPASTAGLPARSACVGIWPPLSWRLPSSGSVSQAVIVHVLLVPTMFVLPPNVPVQSFDASVGMGTVGRTSELPETTVPVTVKVPVPTPSRPPPAPDSRGALHRPRGHLDRPAHFRNRK